MVIVYYICMYLPFFDVSYTFFVFLSFVYIFNPFSLCMVSGLHSRCHRRNL